MFDTQKYIGIRLRRAGVYRKIARHLGQLDRSYRKQMGTPILLETRWQILQRSNLHRCHAVNLIRLQSGRALLRIFA